MRNGSIGWLSGVSVWAETASAAAASAILIAVMTAPRIVGRTWYSRRPSSKGVFHDASVFRHRGMRPGRGDTRRTGRHAAGAEGRHRHELAARLRQLQEQLHAGRRKDARG